MRISGNGREKLQRFLNDEGRQKRTPFTTEEPIFARPRPPHKIYSWSTVFTEPVTGCAIIIVDVRADEYLSWICCLSKNPSQQQRKNAVLGDHLRSRRTNASRLVDRRRKTSRPPAKSDNERYLRRPRLASVVYRSRMHQQTTWPRFLRVFFRRIFEADRRWESSLQLLLVVNTNDNRPTRTKHDNKRASTFCGTLKWRKCIKVVVLGQGFLGQSTNSAKKKERHKIRLSRRNGRRREREGGEDERESRKK